MFDSSAEHYVFYEQRKFTNRKCLYRLSKTYRITSGASGCSNFRDLVNRNCDYSTKIYSVSTLSFIEVKNKIEISFETNFHYIQSTDVTYRSRMCILHFNYNARVEQYYNFIKCTHNNIIILIGFNIEVSSSGQIEKRFLCVVNWFWL